MTSVTKYGWIGLGVAGAFTKDPCKTGKHEDWSAEEGRQRRSSCREYGGCTLVMNDGTPFRNGRSEFVCAASVSSDDCAQSENCKKYGVTNDWSC